MKPLTKEEVLELIPQKPPFRFIDAILELNEEGIVAQYTFKADESFYPGHFPGNPITPGVVLLEALAQTGVVAYGIYLVSYQMPREEISKTLTVFTEAEVEFMGMVRPGDRITIRAQKEYFRRMKLRAKGEITLDNGTVVCQAAIAGMGVPAK